MLRAWCLHRLFAQRLAAARSYLDEVQALLARHDEEVLVWLETRIAPIQPQRIVELGVAALQRAEIHARERAPMAESTRRQANGLLPDEAERFARGFRAALLEIYGRSQGCERLVWPSECRGRDGYVRGEWCIGCIAGHALGIAPARPLEEDLPAEPPFPRSRKQDG